MNERPIDALRVDILELQAQLQVARDDLAMLWRHAIIITTAVLLFGAWIWIAERDQ